MEKECYTDLRDLFTLMDDKAAFEGLVPKRGLRIKMERLRGEFEGKNGGPFNFIVVLDTSALMMMMEDGSINQLCQIEGVEIIVPRTVSGELCARSDDKQNIARNVNQWFDAMNEGLKERLAKAGRKPALTDEIWQCAAEQANTYEPEPAERYTKEQENDTRIIVFAAAVSKMCAPHKTVLVTDDIYMRNAARRTVRVASSRNWREVHASMFPAATATPDGATPFSDSSSAAPVTAMSQTSAQRAPTDCLTTLTANVFLGALPSVTCREHVSTLLAKSRPELFGD